MCGVRILGTSVHHFILAYIELPLAFCGPFLQSGYSLLELFRISLCLLFTTLNNWVLFANLALSLLTARSKIGDEQAEEYQVQYGYVGHLTVNLSPWRELTIYSHPLLFSVL